MQSLKILHVVEAFTGGIYSYFIDLASVFSKAENVETVIVYSDKRKELDKSTIHKNFDKNIKLIRLAMERELSPLADLKSFIRLVKIIKTEKPDILHLHSSKAGILGRGACFLLRQDIKIFYTPHGYAFLRNDVSRFRSKIYYQIEKWAQRISGNITIACGDTEMLYAKKIEKAVLVRNGVPVANFRNFAEVKNTMRLKVGILGRITAARNPEYFNLLAEKNPEITFLWIGDGELRKSLTASNIQITGWFTDRAKGLLKLNSLDIYLQTSSWEGLPIALLEAMALKKPILATNIIGNKDVVAHNKSGYLFNNTAEFNTYLHALKNAQTREVFGEEGFKRCSELFDSNKNFNELIRVYRDFIK